LDQPDLNLLEARNEKRAKIYLPEGFWMLSRSPNNIYVKFCKRLFCSGESHTAETGGAPIGDGLIFEVKPGVKEYYYNEV
jgi:hypothetical protein